jgi:hypothetical protein
MNTSKTLTPNRAVEIFTSATKPVASGIRFEHNGLSIYVPLRTSELKTVRDTIDRHLKLLSQ